MRQRRLDMVSRQIAARGVKDRAVLEAMRSVPRHLFVPESIRERAYDDSPLPIGEGQTISQPYIVALMTELLEVEPDHRILEIGTGSGYQAAVLSALVDQVFSIEIKELLHRRASQVLEQLEYGNVRTRYGDGYYGWEEEAPFDGIMITAAVDHVPPPLLRQLVDGGKLVLPLGHPFSYQNLVVVTREGEDFRLRQIIGVLFVPMTGKALEKYD
ncbi:MAG: protein-L-isoaspartate(D-aspartate) O-methyltransferase [Spirochaetaceae bacterium]|nr:MAG: protein-L-isoaspartate(D-aspartate) O-methyltransferase [Spirochaetaceae bacterium]